MTTINEHTAEQVSAANASGRRPVVFVHGLWLLASSWDRWAGVFEEAGYAPVLPGWPDDPETVAEANENPEVFAGKTVGQVADHFVEVIAQLTTQPAVVGHSFGGLLTQIIAGRGLSAVSVAIDAAPFRGVLPLPISSLKAAKPVLGNPANRHRAVPLTYDQFRFAFANAVSEHEARQLYDTFAVPAPGVPLFISGERDNTVPRKISEASYKKQLDNPGVTEFVEIPGRGHALTIDAGWREVADTALAFIRRFG
jgi:non-heme chloroperoxidase